MSQATPTMEKLKRLDIAGLSSTRYNKEDLAAYIVSQHEQQDSDDSQIGQGHSGGGNDASTTNGFEAIMRQLRGMEDRLNGKIEAMRNELKAERERTSLLENQVDQLVKIVSSQQRYLEQIDSRDRASKLVILGVAEDGKNLGAASTDEQKIRRILNTVKPGSDLTFTGKRLGQPRQDGSCRPMLVSLSDPQKRKDLLAGNVKDLLAAEQDPVNIKIKKDQHPAIRKEWRRLFEAETAERNKPENAGCAIVFDRVKRQITRDGVVIDRFLVNF